MGREMSHFGLCMAKVTNITDPDKFNRVKCLPIGSKEVEETDWCYVMSPMGGKDSGLFVYPQVEDLVVLAYMDDDPHRPFVLGSFWNTETTPPLTIQDGKNQDYCLRTPKKIEILLHDEDQKQKLTLTMPSETKITVDDENKEVSVKDKAGKNTVTLNWEKGTIEAKAEKKLTLDAGGGKASITLEESGAITIKGNGAITVQGKSIEEKADGAVTVKGNSIEAKGSSSVEVKSSSSAKVSAGTTLDLSGSLTTTVKGQMVKIN